MRWGWRIFALASILILAALGGYIHQIYDASQCPHEPAIGDINQAGYMGACTAEFGDRMFAEAFLVIALVLGTGYALLELTGAITQQLFDRLTAYLKAKVTK